MVSLEKISLFITCKITSYIYYIDILMLLNCVCCNFNLDKPLKQDRQKYSVAITIVLTHKSSFIQLLENPVLFIAKDFFSFFL